MLKKNISLGAHRVHREKNSPEGSEELEVEELKGERIQRTGVRCRVSGFRMLARPPEADKPWSPLAPPEADKPLAGRRTEGRCRVSGFRGQGLELKAEG